MSRKILIIIFMSIFTVYLAGMLLFSGFYYPYTKINGIESGLKRPEEIIDMEKRKIDDICLVIRSDQMGEKTYPGIASLDEEFDFRMILEAQKSWMWPLKVLKKHEWHAGKIKYTDPSLIARKLYGDNPEEVIGPKNAALKYDKDTKQYSVTKGSYGNQLLFDPLYKKIKSSLAGMDMDTAEVMVDISDCYEAPDHMSDSEKFMAAKNFLDRALLTCITYKAGDREIILDADTIHDFLCWDRDFDTWISKEKVRDYVENTLAAGFNTVGRERKLKVKGAGKITVSGGTYGWAVDVEKEKKKLLKDIKTGKNETREPAWKQKASGFGSREAGDTYACVSIADQHMWYVSDGKVVLESDVVTGKPSDGHGTHKGVYFLEYKVCNYTMRKYNAYVRRWMPFDTCEGVGFHDADWRSSFGGSIYKKDGSHGCVNMPVKKAKALYSMIEEGCPVIVY